MNYYTLTKFGRKYLNNRGVMLRTPCIYSSSITTPANSMYNAELTDMELIDNLLYGCTLYTMNNKLLFKFDITELSLRYGFNSVFIGFRECLDSPMDNTMIEELKRLIYIDPTNAYNGITTQEVGEEDIVIRREKRGQIQFGTNTIILENTFKALIYPNEELRCDINELSIKSTIHNVYPYYENL